MNLNNPLVIEIVVAIVTVVGIIVTAVAAIFRGKVTNKTATGLAIRTAYLALTQCKTPKLIEIEPQILANVMEELQSGAISPKGAKWIVSIFERLAVEYNAEAKVGQFFANLLSQVFVVTDDSTDIELIRKHAEELKKLILLFTKPTQGE